MKKISKLLAFVLALVTVMTMFAGFGIGAQAAAGPSFELVKASENGNIITAEFKLKNGGFNALDVKFVTTGDVVCKSMNIADGLMGSVNPATKSASVIYSTTPITSYSTKGAVITATFQVPSGSDYSITAKVTNCAICSGEDNDDVTGSVKVSGTIGTASTSIFVTILNAIVSFFKSIVSFFSGLFA